MYPSACAGDLPPISKEEMRAAIEDLLEHRDPSLWMLFGTLPFYGCSDSSEDRRLLARLKQEPNVTVRNDPYCATASM